VSLAQKKKTSKEDKFKAYATGIREVVDDDLDEDSPEARAQLAPIMIANVLKKWYKFAKKQEITSKKRHLDIMDLF
jgi:hypothetical protein